MQRFCLSALMLVFLLFSATALSSALAEEDSVRNISDRVKLERSEAPEKQSAGEARKDDKDAPETEKSKTGERKAAEKAEESLTQKPGAEAESEAEADKQAASAKARDSARNLMGKSESLYDRKGRPDPFAPFVSGPEPSSQDETQKKKLQRREPRTPLERMSLGQLQLTAVMEAGEQNIALVEEASGKGYVVKKGTYIGNEGGRVTAILPNAIVIEEKYLDVFGNVDVRKKQLKLQK